MSALAKKPATIAAAVLVAAFTAACSEPKQEPVAVTGTVQPASPAEQMNASPPMGSDEAKTAAVVNSDSQADWGAVTQAPQPAQNEPIRNSVTTVLANEPGLNSRSIAVAVDNGVVTLTGSVPDAASAEKAKTLAMGVPGVVDVQSKLTVQG